MGQFDRHSSRLVSGGYLYGRCTIHGCFDRHYGWHPCTETESMVASTYWGDLRTSGQCVGPRAAHDGPAASPW